MCFRVCVRLWVPLDVMGYTVVQFVEALRYKLEDCGFNSWWCQWNLSFT
jgi:hypothetical protein